MVPKEWAKIAPASNAKEKAFKSNNNTMTISGFLKVLMHAAALYECGITLSKVRN
jgi:hypothetical protein